MNIESLITEKCNMAESHGATKYKEHVSQQHYEAFQVFYDFLKIEKPDRILEIGTGEGGFAVFLRDCCNDLKLDIPIKSYDIAERGWYDTLRDLNVDIIVENIFKLEEGFWTDVKQEVTDYVQTKGKTIILCDGGHKPTEFQLFSERMKSGDFILAHDYAESHEIFEAQIKNKIWNWCEITEADISKACLNNNLEDYNKETFNSVVWTCKRKK